MTNSLRGPAWGKDGGRVAPLYPPHLLNEMEQYLRRPTVLLPAGSVSELSGEADRLLLAYLRDQVPFLIEALRGANAA